MKLTEISARLSLAFFFTFVLFGWADAQTGVRNFNRPRAYDVQHYLIRTNFDHAAKTVFGDTTVSLKPLKDNFTTVELDAADMQFQSVTLEPAGQNLEYKATGAKILVSLDKPYSAADTIAIRFKYTAKPTKGVYFVDAERRGGTIIRDAQIWTQGEPEEAHHWFPSFDFPEDKATTEQIITVGAGETAVANGELLGETENGNGTKTYHYRMPVPHSTYLVSFVIGKYVKVSDSYKNIPLGYYMYPGRENLVPRAYGTTKDMFRIFEELTGVNYPFNKYDQTVVANFHFGGMENITATTMSDTYIFFAPPSDVEDLVSHELAHSWFGNLVTCRNWAELWLNEGFATFMEAAYREKKYGRDNYMRKIRNDAAQFLADDAINRRRHGLFNQLAGEVDALFDNPATTYQKGGAVIHTLRETIGDEAFWRGVNIYLNRHKFASVETPDLQRAMEEASKSNLDWFFKQWVYGAGHPKLDVQQAYNAGTRTLQLTILQTQRADEITPAVFTLPMEVEITTTGGVKTEKITVDKRQQVFTFKLPTAPTRIVFDKEQRIPLKTVRVQPLAAGR